MEDLIGSTMIRCYDTGGQERFKPLLRYHIVLDKIVPFFYLNGEVSLRRLSFEMDESGKLYQEPYSLCTIGCHLGKRVKFTDLPTNIQEAVTSRLGG